VPVADLARGDLEQLVRRLRALVRTDGTLTASKAVAEAVLDVAGFVREWLLAPGALDGMNAEARDILLMLVNTGLRPAEVTDAPVGYFTGEGYDGDMFWRLPSGPSGLEISCSATRDLSVQSRPRCWGS
jgi:hypothetical protein